MTSDPWQRAQALSRMFFERYSHEPTIAVARFICGWTPTESPRRVDLARLRERSHDALRVMEQHLASHAWFTGGTYWIADIALFAYSHVAPHGGIALDAYPAIGNWLDRARATPGFVPMVEPDTNAAALIAQSS